MAVAPQDNWSKGASAEEGRLGGLGAYIVRDSQGKPLYWITPSTGKIHYLNGTGEIQNTGGYSGSQDYGLGAGAGGIMVVARDAQGTPTRFYVGTAGGGGKVVDSLADAQTLAQSYNSWYDQTDAGKAAAGERAKAAAAGNAGGIASAAASPAARASAPSSSTTSTSTPAGVLTKPGVGETWQQEHAGEWNTPTASEQAWNGLGGKFNDFSGIDTAYNNEERRTRNVLRARNTASGIADSGAAARATADIGANFADRKNLAYQDWAKTGMGLAGASDSARTNRLVGGQNSANQAQTLMIGRETGGLDSATAIANGLGGVTGSMTTNASNSQKDYQTSVANILMAKGNLSYQDAMSQASQLMSLLGLGATAATMKK